MADWMCAECESVEIRGIDVPGHEQWSQDFIAAHMAEHDMHLLEHGGDHAAMRTRLRRPALHAALRFMKGSKA